MNKKHEMVEMILNRIDQLGIMYDEEIGCGETKLRADDKFWERYPQGYHYPNFDATVEEKLSCLSERSLNKILSSDHMKPHMTFGDVWHSWGRAGYFKDKPELLDLGTSWPILRLRHDCYLTWFRDAGFQNSCDAYFNGSNGASAMDFGIARRAMSITPCNDLFWEKDGEERDPDVAEAEWNEKWAMFRKAMFLSYPAQAACGKSVFQKVLSDEPELFEEFITLTDKQCAHMNLDPAMTLKRMKELAREIKFEWPAVAEIPMITRNSTADGFDIYAMLRLSEHQVSLMWSVEGKQNQYTIPFPEWSAEDWIGEAITLDLAAESPECLTQKEYLYSCWVNLSVTLLMMAGIEFSLYWAFPSKGLMFDTTPLCFSPVHMCAKGINDVGSLCYDLSKHYMDKKALIARMQEEQNSQ